MLYKYTFGGCDCWLTKRTGEKILAEIAEMEAERRFYIAVREAREKWEATQDPRDWDMYSDLHKDLYGVRPHW